MSQQTIKQQARRTSREMAEKRRKEREVRERRAIDLAEQVMVAIGERDAAVAATEKRAGEALRMLTEREGLSLREAIGWCGDAVSVREAMRLRRLAIEPQAEDGGDEQGGDGTPAPRVAGGGGASAGSAAPCSRPRGDCGSDRRSGGARAVPGEVATVPGSESPRV